MHLSNTFLFLDILPKNIIKQFKTFICLNCSWPLFDKLLQLFSRKRNVFGKSGTNFSVGYESWNGKKYSSIDWKVYRFFIPSRINKIDLWLTIFNSIQNIHDKSIIPQIPHLQKFLEKNSTVKLNFYGMFGKKNRKLTKIFFSHLFECDIKFVTCYKVPPKLCVLYL